MQPDKDKLYTKGTNDKVPVVDEDIDWLEHPLDETGDEALGDYTEETDWQLKEDIEDIENSEAGMLPESELLRESPIYDDELAMENLENDWQSDENDNRA